MSVLSHSATALVALMAVSDVNACHGCTNHDVGYLLIQQQQQQQQQQLCELAG
jgi:hypothetical protein